MNLEKIKIQTLETVKPTMLDMGFSPEKFNKEAGFVCQIWNDPKNSYLRKSTKESLFSAVVSIAQTGLTLNPVAKQAYLIPRSGKACLEPSYIGLMKLLTDAGQVKNIQTNLVYDGDEFSVNLGMETTITHQPYYITGKQKGNIKGVYSVANLSDGNKQFEYMTKEDVEEIRDTSESYKAFISGKSKQCIWKTYEGEMFRKTCIKRIAKHLPRSEQFNKADDLSNRDYEMQWWQFNKIEQLLDNATLLETQKEQYEKDLPSMNYNQANTAIKELELNQKDSIESGNNYQASDIDRKIDEKLNDPKS
jgi:phage RecT family recombinase